MLSTTQYLSVPCVGALGTTREAVSSVLANKFTFLIKLASSSLKQSDLRTRSTVRMPMNWMDFEKRAIGSEEEVGSTQKRLHEEKNRDYS
ncbi:hypothetical protein B296_00004406 [Ensete ventricosum]|uniref:Uncharacterized protein n=1 Tax=Ensete ventricosum TaxID=4639 RepID=A0A427B8Y1_ENSVE|nr:hypothetical protein B296_00004406 [Ensete ventricosum]